MIIKRIRARRPFTRTHIPGARWVINQYVGCAHRCAYCYARFMDRFYHLGEWGQWLVIKENLPDLVKGHYVQGWVYMSSVSDPYQPIEVKLKLTRRVLLNMDKRIKLSVLTKSDLIVRDVQILRQFSNVEVGLTVNDLPRAVEPGAPAAARRVNALQRLSEAGLTTYAFISPIIPAITDVEALIKTTKPFVHHYWFELLNLRASGPEFRKWLKQEYPQAYGLLRDASGLKRYAADLEALAKKHGIRVRGIVLHDLKSAQTKNQKLI